VCGRCLGLYVGGALGLFAAAWRRAPRENRDAAQWRRLVGLAAVPTLLTVLVEWAGAPVVTTMLRAVCAVPLGIAAGWVLAAGIRDMTARSHR
jgi:uncharacterized membrane protein